MNNGNVPRCIWLGLTLERNKESLPLLINFNWLEHISLDFVRTILYIWHICLRILDQIAIVSDKSKENTCLPNSVMSHFFRAKTTTEKDSHYCTLNRNACVSWFITIFGKKKAKQIPRNGRINKWIIRVCGCRLATRVSENSVRCFVIQRKHKLNLHAILSWSFVEHMLIQLHYVSFVHFLFTI